MAVFQRGRIWWYKFRVAGVHIRESAKTTSRDVALQAEAIRRAELGARPSDTTPSRALTFDQFARKEFAPWCANEHRAKPATFARYMRSIKALSEFFGKQKLEQINAGMVERYKVFKSQRRRKNARDGRLVTPAAVNRDLAVLRILFNFAMRLGAAKANPVKGVKFLREDPRHMRVLSAGEEAQYLAAAAPLLRDVAMVILETGMRPGEAYRLRKEDVDLELRAVHVRQGKTANAKRFIPLTQRACAVLSRRLMAGCTEWVFPCPFDVERPVADVRKAHNSAVERSGIRPRFRLYDLRHTALTRMALSGMDLPTLKELAGHSQIQMTMRYVHPTPEHKRRAIDKFERFASCGLPADSPRSRTVETSFSER